ncbi:hypothetical protein GCK32_014724 [Trichostrongylus colubriformis]|uniref:G protein-coupled receptor n=1 Tax=Trichostrongylus colubriformis TaxID=6319 RepID=A0AAN8GF71_TRICO
MMLCLQQLMKAVATLTANTDLDLWVTMQFYWIHDVMVCIPPLCLVMLSADLRLDIVNILRCARHQKGHFVSASMFNNRSAVRTCPERKSTERRFSQVIEHEMLTAQTVVMEHNVLHTVIEGVLACTYVFVLFIIITSRAHIFKTAFYVMFVAIGCADVFSLMATCTHRLSRQLAWGPEYAQLIRVAVIVSGFTFLTHMIGNMLLTINRYSALCLMRYYDRIWTRRNVWIMICIQYVVAFAAFSHGIGMEVLYTKSVDGRYIYAGIDPAVSLRNRSVFLIGSFLYSFVSVAFNTRLLVEWRRLAKMGGSSSISRHEKVSLVPFRITRVSTVARKNQVVSMAYIASIHSHRPFQHCQLMASSLLD